MPAAEGVRVGVLVALIISCVGAVQIVEPAEIGSEQGGRMCEEGGYCSVGHSQVWTGNIGPSENLRAMLEAVSYKKEIILTSLTSADEQTVWLDPVLQLHSELEQAGYAHFVVHTTNETTCKQLFQYRNVSCVWDYSPSLKGRSQGRHGVWYMRWKFFARAGRMGYNVMNLDADTIVFRDMYAHVKRKPMSDIQMWCNPEGGGPLQCNGGFMYIQNIRPDGPIAWVFKNIVDEQVWMMDDAYEWVKLNGGVPGDCHYYDQELIYDGVKSAFIGRPITADYTQSCHSENWTIANRFGARINRTQVLQNIFTLLGDAGQFTNEVQVTPPSDWMPEGMVVEPELTRQLVNRLSVPNMAYGFPAELGGRPGPSERGPYTAAWQATLKSDCPDCPWWNDNRPLKGGRDDLDVVLGPGLNGTGKGFVSELFWDEDVPVEHIGVGPAWLANSINGYRNGLWAGHGEPGLGHTTAIVHIHHWPGITSWHKTVARKIVGRYNWELGALTSQDGNTPYTSGYPVTRVLALHPSIDLSRTRSLEEYNKIVLGLIQVAQLTHRTVVIPDVPCEAIWLHANGPQGACQIPINWADQRYPQIWSMPYAVDPATRMMVGGWTRRLLSRLGLGPRPTSGPTAAPGPVRRLLSQLGVKSRAEAFEPKWTHRLMSGTRKLLNWGQGATEQGVAGGERGVSRPQLPLGTTYVVDASTWLPVQPSHMLTSSHSGTVTNVAEHGSWVSQLGRRLLGGLYRTPQERAAFWSDKKFMYSLSWNADHDCTREIGNPGGIMMHELAHWLTTPAARNATWQPEDYNTALPAAEGLEGDALRVKPLDFPLPHGDAHTVSQDMGWSVADTQVLLPVGQLIREMSRFAREPLVYLGHPVALISSSERASRGDDRCYGQTRFVADFEQTHPDPESVTSETETTVPNADQADTVTDGRGSPLTAVVGEQKQQQQQRRRVLSSDEAGHQQLVSGKAADGQPHRRFLTVKNDGQILTAGHAAAVQVIDRQSHQRGLSRYEYADMDGLKGKLIGDASEFGAKRLSVDALNSMFDEMWTRVKNSGCRALWASKNGNDHTVIDLTFPTVRLGIVQRHRVRLWAPPDAANPTNADDAHLEPEAAGSLNPSATTLDTNVGTSTNEAPVEPQAGNLDTNSGNLDPNSGNLDPDVASLNAKAAAKLDLDPNLTVNSNLHLFHPADEPAANVDVSSGPDSTGADSSGDLKPALENGAGRSGADADTNHITIQDLNLPF